MFSINDILIFGAVAAAKGRELRIGIDINELCLGLRSRYGSLAQ